MTDTAQKARGQSPTRLVLRRLMRNKGAVIGGTLIFLLIGIAVFAPYLTPYEPNKMSPKEARQAPSRLHPLGTDHFGRDMLSRILHGTKLSLRVGLVGVSIAALTGTFLGLLVGYYGGPFDLAVMRLVDIMLAFPGMLLALAIIVVLSPSLTNAMIAVGVSGIPMYVRLVRATTLSAKEDEYVLAARALGASDAKIISRHVLPNIMAPVIVMSTMTVASSIVFTAGLSFLGLGAQPPLPEWGAMLNSGRMYLRTCWWMMVFPGSMIMLTALSINMLGDGLRDALDPKLKH